MPFLFKAQFISKNEKTNVVFTVLKKYFLRGIYFMAFSYLSKYCENP